MEHDLDSASVDWGFDHLWMGPVGIGLRTGRRAVQFAGFDGCHVPSTSIESHMCERYSGRLEMPAVSLWAVALYYDADFGISGYYQHAVLEVAYETSGAESNGVTDEEDAIRGRQRCLQCCRFSLFFAVSPLAQFI